jgi:phosphatidylserine decarboxylase
MARIMDFFKVFPQYLIPKHFLSGVMHSFMQIEVRWIKNNVIKLMTKIYGINISEAKSEDVEDYPHFNAFFTRELKPDARPIDWTLDSWCSPVDGVVSHSSSIKENQIIPAKGHPFTLEALLGGDINYAKKFKNGDSAVIYLSPKDYHRIHMPCDASLVSMTYVPGDLFAVNPATVRNIPGLFARNERLIIRFKNEHGHFCLIMVGAIFVGSMETVWQGKVTPEYEPTIQHWDYKDQNIKLNKADELGRFNMGSTVVLLTPEGTMNELGKISNNAPIQMGQYLAKYNEIQS